MTERVNLIVVGAQKSGTTTLHSLLVEHPQVFMARGKELNYFGSEYHRGEAWYQEQFSGYEGQTYIGESSPAYTLGADSEQIAQRIFDYNPQARILYIVRDPVERAISGYWHQVSKQREVRAVDAAIREDAAYVCASRYASRIIPFMDRFGEGLQILVFEEMKDDMAGFLNGLYDWLNIEKLAVAETPSLVRNQRKKQVVMRDKNSWLGRLRTTRLWSNVRGIIPAGVANASDTIRKKSPMDQARNIWPLKHAHETFSSIN